MNVNNYQNEICEAQQTCQHQILDSSKLKPRNNSNKEVELTNDVFIAASYACFFVKNVIHDAKSEEIQYICHFSLGHKFL